MPTVLGTGPTVMPHLPFSFVTWQVTIVSIDYTYPVRDGQAEYAWVT